MVEELDIAELLSTWTTCKTLPAPVTVPVKAKLLAKLIFAEVIALSAKAPAGNVLSAMLCSY
jgi:hypothetical protein